MVGIPTGAVACGALVEYAPAPRLGIDTIMTVLLTACIALMAMSPETVGRVWGGLAALPPVA
jgi:hypothetical protein